MAALETQARGEVPAVVERRPGTGGRGSESECEQSSPFPRPPACTRGERRPLHPSAPVAGWTTPSLNKRRGARRNRRAPGASSGGKNGDDGRLRPEATCFPPVGGDRQIADLSRHQSTARPFRFGKIFPSYLLHLRYLRADCDGWAAFVPSCLRCLALCSLCLCGFARVSHRVCATLML
jgi:hypothetical protein